jgi:hypothetical protein
MKFVLSLFLVIAAGFGVFLFTWSCYGQEQSLPADGERVLETSKCTPILREFKGMRLVEAKIDTESDLTRLVYYRKLSKHSVVLFLVVIEECKGPYKIVNAKEIDPNPETCPENSTCL